jgi:hypothetical protein
LQYIQNGVKNAEQLQEHMAQHRGQTTAEDIIWWQIDDNHQSVILFPSEDAAKSEFTNIEEYRKSDDTGDNKMVEETMGPVLS